VKRRILCAPQALCGGYNPGYYGGYGNYGGYYSGYNRGLFGGYYRRY
jgi:hypothetical protein